MPVAVNGIEYPDLHDKPERLKTPVTENEFRDHEIWDKVYGVYGNYMFMPNCTMTIPQAEDLKTSMLKLRGVSKSNEISGHPCGVLAKTDPSWAKWCICKLAWSRNKLKDSELCALYQRLFPEANIWGHWWDDGRTADQKSTKANFSGQRAQQKSNRPPSPTPDSRPSTPKPNKTKSSSTSKPDESEGGANTGTGSRKRDREQRTPDSLYDSDNERKKQKANNENQNSGNGDGGGYSGDQIPNEDLRKANERIGKLEAVIEALTADFKKLKTDYEAYKENTKIRIEGLGSMAAQHTRATNWAFGRIRATMKKADSAATIAKDMWKELRGGESMPQPRRQPSVVNVSSFKEPNANPSEWNQ